MIDAASANLRKSAFPEPLVWTVLWLALVAVSLIGRPLMPIDETRYLSVAWDMWQRGDFLVPHLNGQTYSHKPPLLFWTMHAGWAVFGVNDWWPRLVAPLFGLGTLFLTRDLARCLWPDRPQAAFIAPVIVLGSLYWTAFVTMTFADPLLAFFALLGIRGLIAAWRSPGWRGFVVVGIAIGFGVLAKGPAILLHVLPAGLLAPLWGPLLAGETARPRRWRGWYAGIIASVLLGAAIGLAWAIPAAIVGGTAYADAIFWGQSAGRVVESFAHERPWWWYAALLPALVLPWPLWPGIWRAVGRLRANGHDGGIRLCLAWFVPAFLLFSAISGKQPHYLLPEFSALALIAARLLTEVYPTPAIVRLRSLVLPGLLFGAIGIALAIAPELPLKHLMATDRLQPAWAILPFGAIAVAVGLFRQGRLTGAAFALGLMTVVSVAAGQLTARETLAGSFDLSAVAERLGAWQRAGHRLANFGKYHGQFNFLGRLTAPIDLIDETDAAAWIAAHPDGKIVSYYREPPASGPQQVAPFRGKWVAIWNAADAAKDLAALRRE